MPAERLPMYMAPDMGPLQMHLLNTMPSEEEEKTGVTLSKSLCCQPLVRPHLIMSILSRTCRWQWFGNRWCLPARYGQGAAAYGRLAEDACQWTTGLSRTASPSPLDLTRARVLFLTDPPDRTTARTISRQSTLRLKTSKQKVAEAAVSAAAAGRKTLTVSSKAT